MNITGLFEDLDRLKEELFRAEDKFEELLDEDEFNNMQ